MLSLLLSALVGYLLGAVPFGLVLTRLCGAGDIRQLGSGNIGATNVLRTGRKGLAAATLILDGGKGALAAALAGWLVGPQGVLDNWLAGPPPGLVAVLGNSFPVWLGLQHDQGTLVATLADWLISPQAGLAAGFAAVLGHNFPIWLGFRGGKGVATTLGVLLVTAWPVGVGACLTWLVAAKLFRYSSLAALVALALSPLYALWFATPAHAVMAAGLAVLGFIRHHANIRRLLKGEEPRIGARKKG